LLIIHNILIRAFVVHFGHSQELLSVLNHLHSFVSSSLQHTMVILQFLRFIDGGLLPLAGFLFHEVSSVRLCATRTFMALQREGLGFVVSRSLPRFAFLALKRCEIEFTSSVTQQSTVASSTARGASFQREKNVF
jgi:hypothetical protein